MSLQWEQPFELLLMCFKSPISQNSLLTKGSPGMLFSILHYVVY